MTGRDDELLPEGVPAFDDPAYDDLRAELSGLGDVGPMPADVAARLDDVLAGLRGTPLDDPAEPLTDAPVVPLRRRSSVSKRLLVAAAAVVAVGGGGIGLANVVDGSSDDAGSVAADSSVSAPEAAAGDGGSNGDGTDLGGPATGYSMDDVTTVPLLTKAAFAADAVRFISADTAVRVQLRKAERLPAAQSTKDLREASGTPAPMGGQVPDLSSPQRDDSDEQTNGELLDSLGALNRLSQQCDVRGVRGGVARPILLDDAPAILVVYPAVNGERLVQARSCDANTVLISAFVPVS